MKKINLSGHFRKFNVTSFVIGAIAAFGISSALNNGLENGQDAFNEEFLAVKKPVMFKRALQNGDIESGNTAKQLSDQLFKFSVAAIEAGDRDRAQVAFEKLCNDYSAHPPEGADCSRITGMSLE